VARRQVHHRGEGRECHGDRDGARHRVEKRKPSVGTVTTSRITGVLAQFASRYFPLLGRSAARRSAATPALLASVAPRLARNLTQYGSRDATDARAGAMTAGGPPQLDTVKELELCIPSVLPPT